MGKRVNIEHCHPYGWCPRCSEPFDDPDEFCMECGFPHFDDDGGDLPEGKKLTPDGDLVDEVQPTSDKAESNE